MREGTPPRRISLQVGDQVEIFIGGIWYQRVPPSWEKQVEGHGPFVIERIEGNEVSFAGLKAQWDLSKVRKT